MIKTKSKLLILVYHALVENSKNSFQLVALLDTVLQKCLKQLASLVDTVIKLTYLVLAVSFMNY
jgi:hypothetical protein